MNLVHSVSSSCGYRISEANKKFHEVVDNPSAVKKVLQLVIKLFAAADLYRQGDIQNRGMIEAMKEGIEVIDLCESFKNLALWIHPLFKDFVDRERLSDSLKSSFAKAGGEPDRVDDILSTIMEQKARYRKNEVHTVLKEYLEENNLFECAIAKDMVDHIEIQKTVHPVFKLLEVTFVATSSVGSSIAMLKKWEDFEWAQAGVRFGGGVPLFAAAAQCASWNISGVMASAGSFAAFGNAYYGAVHTQKERPPAIGGEGEKWLNQVQWVVFWDLLSKGTDCIVKASPLLLALSPQAIGVMGGIKSVVAFGKSSHAATGKRAELNAAGSGSNKEAAEKKWKSAQWDLYAKGTDFVAVVSPLVFTMSPLTIVMLAVIAKGTAVVAVLVV